MKSKETGLDTLLRKQNIWILWNGERSLEFLRITASFRAAPTSSKNLITSQNRHFEHGVSLDYLKLPVQTTASLA